MGLGMDGMQWKYAGIPWIADCFQPVWGYGFSMFLKFIEKFRQGENI